MLGPRLCARALSSRGKQGPLLIAVGGPLTIVAPPAAEHKLQTRRLSNCGSRAQPLRGMWDPPTSGLELVSPALAGRFSTTAPPGKPCLLLFNDRKILLCLTPFDGFSCFLDPTAWSAWVLRKPKTTIKETTHCRVRLLLRIKLVVQKIYWENVSEHRAKYKEVELMREKKTRRTDPGNPTRD